MALQYYKVVITRKSFSLAPKYPEDGYLAVITDRSATSLRIDNSRKYNGGREGLQYLAVGEYYMISVTYCLQDGTKYYGNAVKFAYKGPAGPAPTTAPTGAPAWSQQVSIGAGTLADGHLLTWAPLPDNMALQYYKVVITRKSFSLAPKYPEDGYLAVMTDRSATSLRIDNSRKYNGGREGLQYLAVGEYYMISITYCLQDGTKYYGNAVKFAYKGPAGPTPTTAPTEAAPAWSQQVAVGEGSPTDGHLMTWTNPSSEWLGSRWLDGVKIVLSISNPTPIYSNDGYLAYLTGGNTSFRLDNGSSYNGGDIPGTGLVPGQSYYASVTYLISDGSRVRGNAVSFVYQGPAG